jgi:hypothetical protein
LERDIENIKIDKQCSKPLVKLFKKVNEIYKDDEKKVEKRKGKN